MEGFRQQPGADLAGGWEASCFPGPGRFSCAAGGAPMLPLPLLAAAPEGPAPSLAALLALVAAGSGPFTEAGAGAGLGRPLWTGASSLPLPRFLPACASFTNFTPKLTIYTTITMMIVPMYVVVITIDITTMPIVVIIIFFKSTCLLGPGPG